MTIRRSLSLLCLIPALLAQLSVTEMIGFGAEGSPIVRIAIGSSTNGYVICSAIQAIGIDPATSVAGSAVFTLANGVIIGSTSTSTPALETGDCGSSWKSANWELRIVVAGTDSARIQGRGGNAGAGRDRAISDCGVSSTTAGGGGGGAGSNAGSGASLGGSDGTATSGGAGGTSNPVGTIDCSAAQNGQDGGDAIEATDGAPNLILAPESGATLEVWGGGGGGGGNNDASPFTGGAGGSPGMPGGATPGGGTSPGDNGLAYFEPGSASVIEAGPGTIDDLGT